MSTSKSILERLLEKCKVEPTGCWRWTAYKNKRGYGQISADGKKCEAYRVSFEMLVGPVPSGLDLDHLCRNRACINPAHLEPVTRRVNVLRGFNACADHARQTHCIHGHEFTPGNTYTAGGTRRKCRICTNASVKRYLKRKTAAAEARP